jgi:hypothetical protein
MLEPSTMTTSAIKRGMNYIGVLSSIYNERSVICFCLTTTEKYKILKN